ncbi:MAG: hypothetical protein MMC33_007801 [Icmadophila ericetorum]|nr:hypothetical protein [Icmadophila ericetorum]
MSTDWRSGSQNTWRGGRARGAGRGSTRGGRGGFSMPAEIPKRDYGTLLETLKLQEVKQPESPPKITGCEYISSYNWMDSKTPTILVPGAPPLWKQLPPKQYKVDTGIYFRDPNAARYPKHPTEPAMRAVFAMQEDFNPSTIDIVACGSTLGNILRFASQKERAFSMDAELVGDTLFIMRKETTPTETIKGVHGYGHTFPEENTEWEADVKGSISHQRIIRYQFGDLTCLVRFESDGYLAERLTAEERAQLKSSSARTTPPRDESLFNLLKDASVSQQLPLTNQASQPLTINLNKGYLVPQNSIFDIKTRSNKYNHVIDMSEVLPRIWISQIPIFIIAYHRDGYFSSDDVKVEDVSDQIEEWETENRDAIGRFHAVLRKIVEFAKGGEGRGSGERRLRRFEICRRSETGPLELRDHLAGRLVYGPEDPYQSALPRDLKERWIAGDEGLEKGDSISIGSGNSDSNDDDDDDDDYGEDKKWDGDGDWEELKDYTACSADHCGYCGRCDY